MLYFDNLTMIFVQIFIQPAFQKILSISIEFQLLQQRLIIKFCMWSKLKKAIYQHRYKLLAGVGIIALGWLGLNHLTRENKVKLSAFFKAIEGNYVKQIIIEEQTAFFRSQNNQILYETFLGNFPQREILAMAEQKNIIFSTKEPALALGRKQITGLLSGLIMVASTFYMLYKAPPSSKSIDMKPQIHQGSSSFEDFYGGDIIKHKLNQIIGFIRDPSKYQRLGARIRRGVLFYGPPGTGKTMLARVLANEAKCQFIKVAASEFIQIFSGMGARRVRELFKEAKACKNGCIIFIDQIDALGNRSNDLSATHQTTSTINQFLSELDGFSQLDKIVVVAATNRLDLVDSAILRAGRFDLKIQISLPFREERFGILNTIASKRLKEHEISDMALNQISDRSEGWCGADLQALVNESVYQAIRKGKAAVYSEDIFNSFEEMNKKLYQP